MNSVKTNNNRVIPELCAVILWMRDGSQKELVFGSRFQAELYLAMIPVTTEPDGYHEVEAAMLSPLVEV